MYIDSVSLEDRDQLLLVATSTGLFTSEEAEALLGEVLDGLYSKSMPEGHQAFSCRLSANDPPIGWTYLAPDQHASDIWNLWWIGVTPNQHSTGVGKLLLHHAEHIASLSGARLLIIETSATEPLTRARRFYEKQGYFECGRIPDFYSKTLMPTGAIPIIGHQSSV